MEWQHTRLSSPLASGFVCILSFIGPPKFLILPITPKKTKQSQWLIFRFRLANLTLYVSNCPVPSFFLLKIL